MFLKQKKKNHQRAGYRGFIYIFAMAC